MTRQTHYNVLVSALTDVGRVRDANEDSFFIASLSHGINLDQNGVIKFASGRWGSFFAVADGMGGAAAGEMASSMGVQTVFSEVQDLVLRSGRGDTNTLESILIKAVGEANTRIYQLGSRNQQYEGMGTTLTIVLEMFGRLLIGQIGDSRAYLIRSNEIRQLTRDQSLVAEWVSSGELTESEARRHPQRNVLLQALGVQSSVELVLRQFAVEPEDVILLCSDGLHGQMTADEIYEVIIRSSSIEDATFRLVDLANARGGPDNITAVLGQFLPTRYADYDDTSFEESSGLFD